MGYTTFSHTPTCLQPSDVYYLAHWATHGHSIFQFGYISIMHESAQIKLLGHRRASARDQGCPIGPCHQPQSVQADDHPLQRCLWDGRCVGGCMEEKHICTYPQHRFPYRDFFDQEMLDVQHMHIYVLCIHRTQTKIEAIPNHSSYVP